MRAAPHTVFTAALALFALCAIAATWLVLSTPWLGFFVAEDASGNLLVSRVAAQGPAAGRLQIGDGVTSIRDAAGHEIQLTAGFAVRDPDRLAGYAQLDALVSERSAVNAMSMAQDIGIGMRSGVAVNLHVERHTPLAVVPGTFWYRLFLAALSFLIVASVGAFRPDSPVTRHFVIAGSSLSFAMLCAAAYGSPSLAMDGRLIERLLSLHWLAYDLCLAAILSLAWVYPKPLPGYAAAIAGFYAAAGLWWIADLLRVLPMLTLSQAALPIAAGLVAASVMVVRRAGWYGEGRRNALWPSLALAAGIAGYLILDPVSRLLSGRPMIPTVAAETLILALYFGIAIRIYLQQLFQINRWVWSAWVFVGVSAAVLALDLLAITVLEFGSQRVLAASLILLAWLYFPIRQLLWSRWSGRLRHGDYRYAIPELIEELLAFSAEREPTPLWFGLLDRLWAPLQLEPLRPAAMVAALKEGGEELHIPAVKGTDSVLLRFADRGGRLFSTDDVQFAGTLVQLAEKIALLQEAARAGAAEERRRVASDLHDHVAPPLLSFIYRADNTLSASAGRAAIGQLRTIIQSLGSTAEKFDGPRPREDI